MHVLRGLSVAALLALALTPASWGFTFRSPNIDIKLVFQAIAREAKVNLILDKSVRGTIPVDLTDVDPLKAMQRIAEINKLAAVKVDAGGSKDTYMIGDPASIEVAERIRARAKTSPTGGSPPRPGELAAKLRWGDDRLKILELALSESSFGQVLRAQVLYDDRRGLLGPSGPNSQEDTLFSNGDKSLYAINWAPVTHSSHPFLYLRTREGNLMIVVGVPDKIAEQVPEKWKTDALGYLRVEGIEGHTIHMSVGDWIAGLPHDLHRSLHVWADVADDGHLKVSKQEERGRE